MVENAMTIEELPAYIMCGQCPLPHYLHARRTAEGLWQTGYVNDNGWAIIDLDKSDNLAEAAIRVEQAIHRFHKKVQRNDEREY